MTARLNISPELAEQIAGMSAEDQAFIQDYIDIGNRQLSTAALGRDLMALRRQLPEGALPLNRHQRRQVLQHMKVRS